jgi:hypothetical protein
VLARGGLMTSQRSVYCGAGESERRAPASWFGGSEMSLLLKAVLVVLAVSGTASAGYVYYNSALSPNNWVYQGGKATNWKDGGVHDAPGPIAGAGHPVLGIGFGAYWLVRRWVQIEHAVFLSAFAAATATLPRITFS